MHYIFYGHDAWKSWYMIIYMHIMYIIYVYIIYVLYMYYERERSETCISYLIIYCVGDISVCINHPYSFAAIA